MNREYKDYIRILGLEFVSKHGVRHGEKKYAQRFEVDVEIGLDLSHASMTDELDDTINYSKVASIVKSVVKGEHCNLIERLALKIIESVSEILGEGSEITVRVRKPMAPLEIQFKTVEVELKRIVKK